MTGFAVVTGVMVMVCFIFYMAHRMVDMSDQSVDNKLKRDFVRKEIALAMENNDVGAVESKVIVYHHLFTRTERARYNAWINS